MPRIEVVAGTLEHARALAPRLQPLDVAEVWAQAGVTPLEAVEISVRVSPLCWAGLIDGEVACLYGVVGYSLLGAEGMPWLLAGDLIHRHRMLFLRRSRPAVAQMRRLYPHLVGYVDQRHTLSVAWLKWLGFTLDEPQSHGWLNLPFHRFEMRD